RTRLIPAITTAARTTIAVTPLGACAFAPLPGSPCRRVAPAATSRLTIAANPAPSTPTGSAGQRASSAPLRAAPAASTPSGAVPAGGGLGGGGTTRGGRPPAGATPRPGEGGRNGGGPQAGGGPSGAGRGEPGGGGPSMTPGAKFPATLFAVSDPSEQPGRDAP